MHWGLRLDPSWSSAGADLFGHGYIWKQPNGSQYAFYRELVQCNIVKQLAKECSEDADFGKAMLKQAAEQAKIRDQGNDLLAEDHRDALNRAKQRIRYYQKKPP